MTKREYRYTLEILEAPLATLQNLPKKLRGQIGYQLELVQREFSGNIKKLKGYKDEYRLRVGSYRVLFRLNGCHVTVYDIGDRKNIYGP